MVLLQNIHIPKPKPVFGMRVILCALFFVLLFKNTNAQGGFKQQYYFNNSLTARCRDVIEAPNGNIVMIGLTYDTLNGQAFNHLTLCIADAQGNKLYEKRYGRATFQYLDNITGSRCPLIKDTNGFYAGFAVLDSNNRYLSTLIRFNYAGDTLWQKKYYDTGTDYVYIMDIAKTIDNGLICTGIFEGVNRQILLIKTDLNGNELWRKKLPNTPINYGWSAARIVQDSVTKKLVIAGYTYSGPLVYNMVLITDSLGYTPTKYTYFNPQTGSFSDLVQLKNKNFVAVGIVRTSSLASQYKSQVVCFNLSGGLLWYHRIDTANSTNSMWTVNLLKDDNVLLGGILDTMQFHAQPSDKIRLIKMRSDGSTIWKKYYRTNTTATNAGEYLTSLNSCLNGGFLLSTYFPYKPNPNPYSIYKIDSTGCDSTVQYCQSMTGLTEIKNQNHKISIYPNPAAEMLNVEWEMINEEATKNNWRIEIVNALGEEVDCKEKIKSGSAVLDVSHLKEGIYFLRLTLGARIVAGQKVIITK